MVILVKLTTLTTVPQFYLLHVGGELLATPWLSAESTLSFGTFLSEEDIPTPEAILADPSRARYRWGWFARWD